MNCGVTFELANGETVTPCHLPKDHEGDHQGWCLGSRCNWPQGFDSEEALVMSLWALDNPPKSS
jgi:hypothetical protein